MKDYNYEPHEEKFFTDFKRKTERIFHWA